MGEDADGPPDSLTRRLHWGFLFLPTDPDVYGTMVGAAVGAEAAFLGLFNDGRQVGNAFPPPVARALGEAIRDALNATATVPPVTDLGHHASLAVKGGKAAARPPFA